MAVYLSIPVFADEIPLNNPIKFNTPTGLAQALSKWLLGILGSIALIFLVLSGIRYMASGGNEEQMTAAKKMFYASIIGIVIAVTSGLIINALIRMFKGGTP